MGNPNPTDYTAGADPEATPLPVPAPEAPPPEDHSVLAHDVSLVIPAVPEGAPGKPPEDYLDQPARTFLFDILSQMIAGNRKDATMYITINGAMVAFQISIAGMKLPPEEVVAPLPAEAPPGTVAGAVHEALNDALDQRAAELKIGDGS